MKLFSHLITIVPVVLLGAVGSMAQLSSDAVVTEIKSLTSSSTGMIDTVHNLNIVNFQADGFEIAQGLGNLTIAIGTFNGQLLAGNTPPFADPAAIQVFDALTTFVGINQQLLELIIQQHSFAQQFSLTTVIGEEIRNVESVIGDFAFGLVNLIPTRQGPAMAQFAALNVTFTQANTVYES